MRPISSQSSHSKQYTKRAEMQRRPNYLFLLCRCCLLSFPLKTCPRAQSPFVPKRTMACPAKLCAHSKGRLNPYTSHRQDSKPHGHTAKRQLPTRQTSIPTTLYLAAAASGAEAKQHKTSCLFCAAVIFFPSTLKTCLP